MTSLKDHQAAMVSMLASGTAIPTSAIRLAHALHDVLAYLNDTNVAPEAHTELRIDATTPGLNDALLAEAFGMGMSRYSGAFKTLAENSGSDTKQQQSLESLLKQRENTIRQIKGRVADLVKERDDYKFKLNRGLRGVMEYQEQAGCRKEDTQLPDDGWIEWGGGKCPVGPLVDVEVRHAGIIPTSHEKAQWLQWSRVGSNWDIIAYRIVGGAK